MRELPQASSERSEKIYKKQTPGKSIIKFPIKKIILYISIGIAITSTVIAVAVVVSKSKKNYSNNDDLSYLIKPFF